MTNNKSLSPPPSGRPTRSNRGIRHNNTRYEKRQKFLKIIVVNRTKSLKRPIKPSVPIECSICCEVSDDIKYINCIKKGLQDIDFGKWRYCCKDKGICFVCRERERKQCPFCRSHKLYLWKKGMGQKVKKTFAEAEIIRQKKLKKKMKLAGKNEVVYNITYIRLLTRHPLF